MVEIATAKNASQWQRASDCHAQYARNDEERWDCHGKIRLAM